MNRCLFLVLFFLSVNSFALDVNVLSPNPLPVIISSSIPINCNLLGVSTPVPVYLTPNVTSVQSGAVSDFVRNVTLGDIWILLLLIGAIQIIALGLIFGHQR
jgi:hypothetical protein